MTEPMRKPFLKDDSGVAYGIFAVIVFILFMGTIVVWYIPLYNSFVSIFNGFISQNMISQNTSDAMEFDGFIINSMVAFILFGVACWGIIRALEKKRQEGGY